MRVLILFLCSFFMASVAQAQSPVGTWKTVDDESGTAKSHVEIFEYKGMLCGKITALLEKDDHELCDKCPGDLKNKPVMGLQILESMEPSNGLWKGGRILDPEKGKWYTCKIWLEEGNSDVLVVRGFIGPFYRTQKWYRVK